MQIAPDWEARGTAAQLEAEIGGTFKFKGPGLYIGEDGEFAIVAPAEDPKVEGLLYNPWNDSWPPETEFVFYKYNTEMENTIYGWTPMPTRQDDR